MSATSRGFVRGARFAGRGLLAAVLAGAVVMLGMTPAFADIVSNTVVAGGSPTVRVGETTSIGYSIQNQNTNAGDTQNSCNPGGGTPATLTVNKPAAVTVTPASRSYSSCDTTQFFDFSSTTPGSYQISVSVADAGGGVYVTSWCDVHVDGAAAVGGQHRAGGEAQRGEQRRLV